MRHQTWNLASFSSSFFAFTARTTHLERLKKKNTQLEFIIKHNYVFHAPSVKYISKQFYGTFRMINYSLDCDLKLFSR